MNYKNAYAILICFFVAFVVVAPAASTSQPSPEAKVYEFPIDGANHPIFIPFTAPGKSGYFILDTGSASSVFDTFAFPDLKDLHTTVKMFTAGGQQDIEVCEPPDMNIGPIHFREGGLVGKMDLSSLQQSCGRPILGIVGISAIREFVVQIDFDNKRLRFLSPDYEPHPDWGRAFGLQGVRGVPAIIVRLADGDYPICLDTGWMEGDIALPSAGFEKAKALGHPSTIGGSVWTPEGIIESQSMRWGNQMAMGWHYHDLIVDKTKGDALCFGLPFLSRHVITFDFPHYIFYVKQGRQFNRRSEIDMSGLSVLRISSRNIATVLDGGPAYQAGIRDDDVILSVDGKASSDWDLLDLKTLLCSQEGRQISVSYWHEGESRTATFKLQRRL